jgi:hypothetical protein
MTQKLGVMEKKCFNDGLGKVYIKYFIFIPTARWFFYNFNKLFIVIKNHVAVLLLKVYICQVYLSLDKKFVLSFL